MGSNAAPEIPLQKKALQKISLGFWSQKSVLRPASDSVCFLSSSQWTGEGKSPSMHRNPDADIMRDIVQLLRERIEQDLLTIFIKIKAHRGDPLNEQADRWADEGRQSENIRWSLPSNRPIFYWTDNGTTHQSPMNPTVKEITYRYLNNN